jgi:hypothetical protein
MIQKQVLKRMLVFIISFKCIHVCFEICLVWFRILILLCGWFNINSRSSMHESHSGYRGVTKWIPTYLCAYWCIGTMESITFMTWRGYPTRGAWLMTVCKFGWKSNLLDIRDGCLYLCLYICIQLLRIVLRKGLEPTKFRPKKKQF